MPTAPQLTDPAIKPAWVPGPPFRMSIEQYEAMVESNVLGDHDKFHLINGVLFAKMTQKSPHCTADTLCRDELMRVIPAGWHVRSDKPLRLPHYSKPELDQCVVRGAVPIIRDSLPALPTLRWSSSSRNAVSVKIANWL